MITCILSYSLFKFKSYFSLNSLKTDMAYMYLFMSKSIGLIVFYD